MTKAWLVLAVGVLLTACQPSDTAPTTTPAPAATSTIAPTTTAPPTTTTTTVDTGPLTQLAVDPVVVPSEGHVFVNPGWTHHVDDLWVMFRGDGVPQGNYNTGAYIVAVNGDRFGDSHVLDFNNSNDGTWNAPLAQGQTRTDAGSGISITTAGRATR